MARKYGVFIIHADLICEDKEEALRRAHTLANEGISVQVIELKGPGDQKPNLRLVE